MIFAKSIFAFAFCVIFFFLSACRDVYVDLPYIESNDDDDDEVVDEPTVDEPVVATGSTTASQSFYYSTANLDLSDYCYLSLDVTNPTEYSVSIGVKYYGPNSYNVEEGSAVVMADTTATVSIILERGSISSSSVWYEQFSDLKGFPGGYVSYWSGFDPSLIKQVDVTMTVAVPAFDMTQIEIAEPYGTGEYAFSDDLYYSLQPILDEMGQSVYDEWDNKLTDVSQLTALGDADWAKYGSVTFSDYGGWKEGPTFPATGRFYTTLYNDKWAFVTPDGYLFWSHGITGVGQGVETSIEGREEFFCDPDILPQEAVTSTSIDFYTANVIRKYGESNDWESKHQQVVRARLQDWGVNTMAAWSDTGGSPKVPYTLIIFPTETSIGLSSTIVDPFLSTFESTLKTQLVNWIGSCKGDPYNLGIFANNEMPWGYADEIAEAVIDLAHTTTPGARNAMELLFEEKYGTIDALNDAWGSSFSSFANISSSGSSKFKDQYETDLHEYFCHYARTYFSTVKAAIDEHMPGHLYLGCRFYAKSDGNIPLMEIASEYCDVISYNMYEYSPNNKSIGYSVDVPFMVTEFHFGTASHGVWGAGLLSASSLEDQADLYKSFVYDALANRQFIGTHWFQHTDQPATGRSSDGENYRIGFVNVTDQIYEPLVEAAQEIGENMYNYRFN